MKKYSIFFLILLSFFVTQLSAQKASVRRIIKTKLYMDVHHLGPGKASFEAVAAAHVKDLMVQDKYHMSFIKYWIDEKNGNVYCLSAAPDSVAIISTHREAHGLLPHAVFPVNGDMASVTEQASNYYLDIHDFGPGKVTAADVEKAHQKDLAVQRKYGVNFIYYWIDEEKGLVFCLSQADDLPSVIQAHKEAHGLLPQSVVTLKEGE